MLQHHVRVRVNVSVRVSLGFRNCVRLGIELPRRLGSSDRATGLTGCMARGVN